MKRIAFSALLGGLTVLFCAVSIWLSWTSRVGKALREEEPIFGLIVGTDWVDHARHADVILFARYLPIQRKLDLLSIPRDTRVDIPNLSIHRLNEVYAYAYRTYKRDARSALDAFWGTVSALLFTSTPAPPLHFYVQIDYDGFKEIINLLGGVNVDVDEPMHYDDHAGKLHIHFSTGMHHLDGQGAMEYVRFRSSTGDAGRVARQQEFLLKALRRLASPAQALRLPALAKAALHSVESNLSGYDCLLAIHELRGLPRDRVRLIQLSGSAKRGYWVPDLESVRATMNLLDVGNEGEIQTDFSKVTVEVWNASGQKGLALEVMRTLREAGFDVVKWGNYASQQKKTFVRDQTGDFRAACAIARALKTPEAEVFTRIETDPLVDMEVVLGRDFLNSTERR